MVKKLSLNIAIPCLMLSLALVVDGYAQETSKDAERDERSAAREMMKYTEGHVVSVDNSSKTIVVKRMDYANAREIEDTYVVEPSTTIFRSAVSLSNIIEGDYVHMSYFVYHRKRIIDTITLERKAHRVKEASENIKSTENVETEVETQKVFVSE